MESRRKFIKDISTATVAMNLLPLIDNIGSLENHLYISESSNFSGAVQPFTLGILKITSVTKCMAKINETRKKNHYRTTFRYRSTDKFKFSYAKDLIDYFIQEKGISFFGRIISGTIDTKQQNYQHKKSLYYHNNYLKAITDALSQNEISTLYLGKHDDNLKAYLKKNIPTIKEIRYTTNDIYQFSQFFAGSISADQSTIRNKIKVSLIKYLKESIGIKEPNKLNVSTNSKFRIVSARI